MAAAPSFARSTAVAARPAPVAERRRVSILFADLVGFTPLAESQDPEEVRELLTRYFETAREIIGRYGGTVEKFIGDAVMAVWGAPVAHEDDAERAVRAALDLTQAIGTLQPSAGVERLELRAAVLTGEAAVTLGATGEGMVAGDLVNTASRLQAAAPAGSVLVGETTYQATNRAIAYEETEPRDLKGKTLPLRAWRAVQVVGLVGGAGRSDRLEPRFVGRDSELQLLKDALHATEREGRARLVSVIGIAGIGKSRLAWEFEKYIDGLVEPVYWHRGRSPAYGEGITFWALGEMVRERAGIAETDDVATTREKLRSMLADYVPGEEDRRWIEPRLLVLLGLEESVPGERDELFAAWRRFFESISDRGPVVMLFDELQWADPGLLDFVESILEWSRSYPILVVTLARPELLEKRPTWGGAHRNFIGLHLERLSDETMSHLVAGLVPGLPEAATGEILSRAEGIPLYAVETIRMLLDEGRLALEDGEYRLVGSLSGLRVPGSLRELIAARLDGLDPPDRSLLQDAAVLGQTFTLAALAAVTGISIEDLDGRLRALDRREFLQLNADPRSPERGQYGFVQSVIREVAYDTLSKADRRARHLAAARYFEAVGDDELAGVVAGHYVAAYRATPPGADAADAATSRQRSLRAAAARAMSLHSYDQALAYLEQALALADGHAPRAVLLDQVAEAAKAAGQLDAAERYLRDALAQHRATGDASALASATARLGAVLIERSQVELAISELTTALKDLQSRDREGAVAELTVQLSRAYLAHDEPDAALRWSERTLAGAARDGQIDLVLEALRVRGSAAFDLGRSREATALLAGGVWLAEKNARTVQGLALRGSFAAMCADDDPRESLRLLRVGLDQARRIGARKETLTIASNSVYAATLTGDWAWALATVNELSPEDIGDAPAFFLEANAAQLDALMGEFQRADARLLRVRPFVEASTAGWDFVTLYIAEAWVSLAKGDLMRAQEAADAALARLRGGFPIDALEIAARSALWRRDVAAVRSVLDGLDAISDQGRLIAAHRRTVRAGLAALEEHREDAAGLYPEAVQLWRELDVPFELGLCLAEFAMLTAPDNAEARAAGQEAKEIFERIGAKALLARLEHEVNADPRVGSAAAADSSSTSL